jgi:deazaflavin-dependent oxidoreductase (nitroreductase family)
VGRSAILRRPTEGCGGTIDEQLEEALRSDRLIDITTTGRRSGEPRRIEIGFFNVEGRIFITGRPGPRGWYANLRADPSFTMHVKESAQADVPASARPVVDDEERQAFFAEFLGNLDRADEIDEWAAQSPLVEVTLGDAAHDA